ncbi:MAG: tetraacyldisaccharide 4'-kinase, partial [Deltaproteobacteria bacterium]|nr:tetraacyldisaccharide 4'-kinase [Deltaproteobacteria bacterium]
AGILKKEELPCRVISVGNITAGGSGKTPMVIFLAKRLREKGLKVLVLSRGYKRKGRGVAAVSDGERTLVSPEEAGDEPYLMAERLIGVPVIVGKDRVISGLRAFERFSPDVIILDDGFQHIRLKRDIDILLLDSKRWFGSGYLLPRGPLREPLDGMKRADIIMIKGGKAGHALEGVEKPCFGFVYRPAGLYDSDGRELDIKGLKGKRVSALCAIANPDSFLETLKGCGAIVVSAINFPDHHWYAPADMERIRKEAGDAELIVTTEKDYVRLKSRPIGGMPVVTLAIEVSLGKKERFLEIIEEKLGKSQRE